MQYLYISIAICIIFTLVGYVSEKRIVVNPVTIFCALWAVILILSALEYYGMYSASDNINGMILIGIIAYISGYYINKFLLQNIHLKIGNSSMYNINITCYAVPRYNLLYFLAVICILYTAYTLLNVIISSGTFNLGTIQDMLQSGDIVSGNSALLNALSILVISPVKFVLPAITAVDFWYGRRDRKLFVLTLILILINMLSSANRTSFLLFFVWLIIVALIYMNQNGSVRQRISERVKLYRMSRNIKRYILLIIIVAVIAFILMSLSRGVQSFSRQLYLYFAIPPRMFEIWAERIDQAKVYGYGTSSLLGFIYPVFYVLKNLIGIELPALIQSMYDWYMLTDNEWVWPGQNIYANAYTSIFWSLYVDGRAVGIAIGMFIFGIIASKAFNNIATDRCSARQIAIYCIIFYAVLFSFVRMQFTLPKYALGLVFIIFFAYRMVPKHEDDLECM